MAEAHARFRALRETAVRGLRGGSWINNDNNARAASRNNNNPNNRNNNIGFRLLCLPRLSAPFLWRLVCSARQPAIRHTLRDEVGFQIMPIGYGLWDAAEG